jgi:hypothetical protein
LARFNEAVAHPDILGRVCAAISLFCLNQWHYGRKFHFRKRVRIAGAIPKYNKTKRINNILLPLGKSSAAEPRRCRIDRLKTGTLDAFMNPGRQVVRIPPLNRSCPGPPGD